jgi:hypothetical protein
MPEVVTSRGTVPKVVKLTDLDMDGQAELLVASPDVSTLDGEDDTDRWRTYRLSADGFHPVDGGPAFPEASSHRSIPVFLVLDENNNVTGIRQYRGPLNIYAGDLTGDGLPEYMRAQGNRLDPLTEASGIAVWG